MSGLAFLFQRKGKHSSESDQGKPIKAHNSPAEWATATSEATAETSNFSTACTAPKRDWAKRANIDRVRPLFDVIKDRRSQLHGWQRIADDLNLPLSPRQLREAFASLGGDIAEPDSGRSTPVAIDPVNLPFIKHQRFR